MAAIARSCRGSHNKRAILRGETMVTAADLRKRILEHPFQPFRVHLTDGRRFDIHDPSWNLVGEGIFLIGVAPDDEPQSRLPDRHERIDYRLIAKVEPLIAASGVN
jgi:hypothetical protein